MTLDALAIAIARVLFFLFRKYFEFLEELVRQFNPKYKRPKSIDSVLEQISPIEEGKTGIDLRIKKIDVARENLQDAIHAIDELRNQADANKAELEDSLRLLIDAEKQKNEISAELANLKHIAAADTDTFRRVVGLPTKSDMWRWRLFGFGSGVLASLIASGMIWLLPNLF